MEKAKAVKTAAAIEVPVLVGTETRNLWFGYATDTTGDNVTLKRARQVIYWSASVKGAGGLAVTGPDASCRIGPAVPEVEARRVTTIAKLTDESGEWGVRCPFGAPGDRLWVRETARVYGHGRPGHVRLRYEVDGAEAVVPWPARLKPPPLGKCVANGVHREGARIFLAIESVRVERAQAISEEDAIAEGCRPLVHESWSAFNPRSDGYLEFLAEPTPEMLAREGYEGLRHHGPRVLSSARDAFRSTWVGLYGAESWSANPWVWVLGFRRVDERAVERAS